MFKEVGGCYFFVQPTIHTQNMQYQKRIKIDGKNSTLNYQY